MGKTARPSICTEEEAREDLGASRTLPPWLEAQHALPFHGLSPDEFEVLSYLLLRRENPGEEIHYYGKTGDAGRDLVRPRAPHGCELIQCKRYSGNVGIGEVRKELAKLFVNVFQREIPVRPDRVTFYVASDLTSPAKDLLLHQRRWVEEAEAALRDHLGCDPPADLLELARTWWPNPGYVAALDLTERVKCHPDLLEEFFSLKKVVDGSLADVRRVVREELASVREVPPDTTDPESPWEHFFRAAGQPDLSYLYLQDWPGLTPDQRFQAPQELSEICEAVSHEPLTFLIGPPAAGKTFTALQLLWEAHQRGLRVVWIAPPTFLATDGPIPAEYGLPDMKERIRRVVHQLSPRRHQPLLDTYDFIARNLERDSLVYIEDPFGKRDEEFTYSLHTYDFFDLDAFLEAIREGARREGCHILISSREGLFERWLEERRAQGKERPRSKLIRIDGDSYDSEERFDLACKLAKARGLQEAEPIAEEIAYRVVFPFEVQQIILDLPQKATAEDAAEAAQGWRGGLVAAVRRQIQARNDEERLLLVATALEWSRTAYLQTYQDLEWPGSAEESVERALSRFGALITRKHITYLVPETFRLRGGGSGPSDILFTATHSTVTEAIARELAAQPVWLGRLIIGLSGKRSRHADAAVYLLSLGIGREAGPAQDAITAILFDAKGLTSRFTATFMRAWPSCDAIFKERLFRYLELDPEKVVREVAARLEYVEVEAEDAWRILRLLLKKRYLVQGGQPVLELFRSHPWRYLARHIDEIPAHLLSSLNELAAKSPALFTYALGEILVEIWGTIPRTFKEAVLSEAAIRNKLVQEKVLRAIADFWEESPPELRDFFLRQSSQGEPEVRAKAASAAWIYWDNDPAVFDPVFMRAADDPEIQVALEVLPTRGEDERDRRFTEALLTRVEGATAAAMLDRLLGYGLGQESAWRLEVIRTCVERGGDLARGVLAERYFSTEPPKPLPFFTPPEDLALEPEVVRLGAVHAYAEGHGNRTFLSEAELLELIEGLSQPCRDWALAYLSIQALHLPETIRAYIDNLEGAEGEDGHAVREGKKKRQPANRRATWRFPVLWLAEALEEVAREVVAPGADGPEAGLAV